MKFILAILSILCLIFLIGCSAKEGISNSEIRSMGKKYGGGYIFSRKYREEIRIREKERDKLSNELGDKIRVKISDTASFIDTTIIDKQLPQTLSNGRKYYTNTREYGNDYKKAPKVPQIYIDKIKNFIGEENWNKYEPSITLSYFYVGDNQEIIPISLSVSYNVRITKYGLFGDEGRGFSLSRDDIRTVKNDNIFYMEDIEKGNINVK